MLQATLSGVVSNYSKASSIRKNDMACMEEALHAEVGSTFLNSPIRTHADVY